MTFKDQIAVDIDNVFLNLSEFADDHVINGIEVKAVIDSDILEERSNAAARGTYLGLKRVFVNESLFPARFAVGARINLDGKSYFVRDCSEEMGMYVITIEANKT